MIIGDMNNKRNAQDLMNFTLILIAINIVANVLYFIRVEDSYSILFLIDQGNKFTIFGGIACILFNILNRGNKVSEEERREISRKMVPTLLFSLPFIGYLIFVALIIKEREMLLSSAIMLGLYINMCFIKEKSFRMSSGLTETQRKWRESQNNHKGIKESNIFWRIKPMMSPRVSVSIGDRIKNINLFLCIFCGIGISQGVFNLDNIIFTFILLIISIPEILYFIDIILGTYTETEGECTGVVMKERSKSRRVYYEIYVTDYENERELKFKEEDYTYCKEGEIIKVIHGGFSKKVIEHKTMRKNF